MKHVIFIILLSSSSLAFSDCVYNGKNYPEGSVVGPYTCQQGKWVQ